MLRSPRVAPLVSPHIDTLASDLSRKKSRGKIMDEEARSESYRAAVGNGEMDGTAVATNGSSVTSTDTIETNGDAATSPEPAATTTNAAAVNENGAAAPSCHGSTITPAVSAKSYAEADRAVQAGTPPDAETLYTLAFPKCPERLAAMGGVDAILKALGSTRKGGRDLGRSEELQERYGVNRLPDVEFKSIFKLTWEALKDKTLIMLIIAAFISLGVGMGTEGPETGFKDGLAVLIAVVVVVAITAVNDYQKERQFRRLNDVKNDRTVTVLRGEDKRERVSVYDLLVGDVVIIDTGDIIPADGVFLSGESMSGDESSAWGESRSIRKGMGEKLDPFFLSGTQLIEGNGEMLVIAVGELSFYGRIMLSLRTPSQDTPLQEKLGKFADAIGNFGIVAALFIFTAQLIKYFAIEGSGVDGGEAGRNVVDFIVIAISIVVVAVPEGLPLAVTISLAYSMRHMMRDNNLVRHLDACETMGGATTICSDKTGTLTQNRMTVHEGRVLERYLQVDEAGKMSNEVEGGGPGFVVDANGTGADLANGALHHLFAGICVNSTAYRADDDAANLARDQADAARGTKRGPTSEPKVSATKYVGNQTECAMLQFADKCGQDYEHWRKQTETVKVYSFTSDRKRMSTVVKAQAGADKPYVLYCKGAAEVVLDKCASVLLADNSVVSLDSDAGNGQTRRDVLSAKLVAMNDRALRAICIAYRPCEDDRDWTLEANADMICVGLIGILDPLRPEIRDAVAKCKTAGVVVRMVTGDSLAIAKNIAANCGIYDPETDGEEAAMEGPTFRALSDRQMRKIAPKLRILARSSPTDKFKLVSVLQAMGDVVAVTGDGVNDGPALKKADIGFAMGLSGTDVAKEAADIVLLDDNFASIVNAIKWGRSVFDNIRKFLQFQLVVNFTAILVVFISVLADEKGGADNTPLKPVQLLWINLIMDSFAAVALATERPTEELLILKPYDRNEPLVTRYMGRRMAMQVILQTITFLVVLYSFEGILQTEKDQFDDPDLQFSTRHLTVVFNAFVLTQLFNQFNARKLRGEINVFAGLQHHSIFIVVWIFAFTVQVLLVQFAGTSVETEALNGIQWAGCLIIALLPLLWSLIFNLLPTRVTLSDWPWYDAFMARAIPLICFCRKKGVEELIEDDNEVSHGAPDQTAVEIGAPSEGKKKREAAEAAASEGEAGDEVSALRSDLPSALGDSSNNRSSGSFHPGGAVHAVRRLSSTDEAGEGLAGEEAAPDELDPAERWRRVMWTTMTQVQVVSAFRRKHR